ncbi:MAG: hypothetical protein Q4B23_05840 [Helcococcus sp.]|nr:hypothetical protein [Helcococcus sp.]
MGTGISGDYKSTLGSLKPEHLMDELKNSGYKYNENDVVMVTKTKKNELVWLEKGTSTKGLKHIIEGHANDFKNKFGVSKEAIPSTIKDIFSQGIEVSSKVKNGGIEKIYEHKGEYIVIAGVGTNGFIVSVYPGGSKK